MDALSKIFDDIHLAKSEYLYLNVFHPGGFDYQHEPFMLAYILLQGQAQLRFMNGDRLELQQGDLVLLPAGSAHHVSCPDNADFSARCAINPYFQSHAQQCVDLNGENSAEHSFILALRSSLDMQMAKPLLSALPKYLHIQHILGDTAPEWLQVGLQFLALETQQMRPGRDKILDHLVSILLIECVRDYILNLENSSSWLNALSHPELSNALAAIHGKPEQFWTVESLAEQCHMSRSKFAQLFTQIVGEPPLAYLQQHRLRLAAQYLRNSGFSIQQIAHGVGYSSETAFSQSFKKQFEQTPTQYRLNCQNNNIKLLD
ncbi:AraC family transcriptional regulator [Acinetobacter pseudolwoffii]|uniref:AraC family transcriptional regulator n=1 Tax=Acinetobacter pseudolwoffii TaxID=2053287 RepID=A0A2H9ULY5_9GAMM|nr:AraC family transcriptional regulator [Acinetobacter pseudolwoffii]PJI32704.1 AraC family transcriptional regulator [Acinetobacter pseudolwoffii]